MTRLIALWRKETLALLRDRHGLAALFVMPVIFILVMTMALHDAFSPGATVDVGYRVVDLDDSVVSHAFSERLARTARFRRLADAAGKSAAPATAERQAAARAGIVEGRHALALVIPAGFGERLLTPGGVDGQPSPPLLLYVDPTLHPGLQLAFRAQINAALGMLRADELSRRAGELFGLPGPAGTPAPRDWPDEIESIAVQNGKTLRPPTSVQQNVPAWLTFAMFFVVVPIAALFIVERQHGTLQRLATLGLPVHLILFGKFLPFFLVNQLQAALMVGVGRYLVPALGGEALRLPEGGALGLWWLVAAAVSAAAVAAALFVASLARSVQQAIVIGGVGNILMGAIGGVMAPKFMMPAAMQRLAELSPMAWGLDAFHTVMLRQGGLADLAPDLGRLLLFAALALLAANALGRRPN